MDIPAPHRDTPPVQRPSTPTAPETLRLRVADWLARVGADPDDPDDLRARKTTLVLASTVIVVLAFVWVATYLALGLPVSAAIPFGYQVLSVAGLIVFARTRDFVAFRRGQLFLITLLPFALQWSLDGYGASSAVSLWALEGAIGAPFFTTASAAVPWFLLFVALTVVSGVIDPMLAGHAAAIPEGLRTAFYVLNISGVSLTAYLLLQYSVRAREAALAQTDSLLLNILPAPIARRLKREPGRVIAQDHPAVTVLFADVADFTHFVERSDAAHVIAVLDEVFSAFDRLAERHGLEKIKTIGDAYMVVAGVPEPRADHAEAAAEFALEAQSEMARLCRDRGLNLQIRVGMATGPVVAGVIGRRKFAYDVWGDTVNTASRMESHGIAGRIQVTEATYHALRDRYELEPRGIIDVKGKGPMPAWLLVGRRRYAAGEVISPSAGVSRSAGPRM